MVVSKLEPTAEAGSPKPTPIYYMRFAFWIILIVALGFLLINQGLKFFYGTHLLKAPCDLCIELNPQVKLCIDNMNNARASYWSPEGWTDPFNIPNITFVVYNSS